MKFLARVVATVILGSLFWTQAFAEDAANSSSSTITEATAPNATGSSTAYLAPFIPLQTDTTAKPKTKATSNGDSYPAVDLFAGYSYIRFRTDSGVREAFSLHGFTGALAGNVNRWFSLVGDFGVYRIHDLPPSVTGSAYTYLFGPRNFRGVVSAGHPLSTRFSALPVWRISRLPLFPLALLSSIARFPRIHLPQPWAVAWT